MLLTIFTPTYNRAHTLPKLYNSLCRQTSKDFYWLIIDDGSTDSSNKIVEDFMQEGIINIKYVFKENGGKHTAHNIAVEECETELFFCVDSDDELTENAVETIKKTHLDNADESFLGYIFRKKTFDGKDSTPDYPDGLKATGIEDLYHLYGFTGELAPVFKTNLIKHIFFPVFENESFLTERVLYNKYNSIAPMLLCNERIYLFEYLEDGLSSNYKKNIVNSPYGNAYDHLSESYYGKKYIYRSLHYSAFIAICHIFGLTKSLLNNDFTVKKTVRFAGYLLSFPCTFYISHFYLKK